MIISESGAVMSDTRTNTLVIKESLDIIHEMEKLIAELDRPTKQVYIQAEIVEVSSTNDKELGVEWLWSRSGAVDSRVGTNFDLQTAVSSQEGEATQQVTDGFPFPVGSGLGVGILNTNVEAVLKALQKTNNVNLLSRPRVMTMDNQESTIEVGDQIPFQKLNQFGVTSFEFKDATVQLLVKPHIVDSTYVMLQVSPKADFQNGFTPDGTPIISTRKASTNVKVRDGQTIVIGGLIRDSLIKSESKVPVLGSIPLLGLLFKSTKSTKIKTELIVFITPIIIEDSMTNTLFDNEFKLKHDLEKKLN
jgi:type II secretion system protein D